MTGAMVEGEIAAKKIVSQLNEERDKETTADENTEKKVLDAKITEYNRYLSNEGGMYETEALEEAMQKVMESMPEVFPRIINSMKNSLRSRKKRLKR